jgi:hypothetical protein
LNERNVLLMPSCVFYARRKYLDLLLAELSLALGGVLSALWSGQYTSSQMLDGFFSICSDSYLHDDNESTPPNHAFPADAKTARLKPGVHPDSKRSG